MPGYGGQTLALDVTPFTSVLQEQARTEQARTQADYDRDASPLRLRQMEIANEQGEASVESTQVNNDFGRLRNKSVSIGLGTEAENASSHTADYRRQQRARVLADIDPDLPPAEAARQWDAAWQRLVDAGDTEAGQFIGQYSAERHGRLSAMYSQSPLSPASVQGAAAASGAEPVLTPELTAQYNAATRGWTQAQFGQHMAQVAPYVAAARDIINSANPMEALARHATELGHPEYAQQVTSPMAAIKIARDILAHEGPMQQYMDQRIREGAAGMPERPHTEQILAGANGGYYAGDPTTPSGAQLRTLQEPAPSESIGGYDADGHLIYRQAPGPGGRPGSEVTGTTPVANGRYGQGGATTRAEFLYNRGRAIGMTEAQATALAANPSSFRTMSPADLQRNAALAAQARVDQAVAINDPDSRYGEDRDRLYQRYLGEALEFYRGAATGDLIDPTGGTPPPPAPPLGPNMVGGAASAPIGGVGSPGSAPPPAPAPAAAAPSQTPADRANAQSYAQYAAMIPASARAQLQEGVNRRFRTPRGVEVWTLRNGHPVRLRTER